MPLNENFTHDLSFIHISPKLKACNCEEKHEFAFWTAVTVILIANGVFKVTYFCAKYLIFEVRKCVKCVYTEKCPKFECETIDASHPQQTVY